jgi:DNA-directed RNA polymerase alpha subunit
LRTTDQHMPTPLPQKIASPAQRALAAAGIDSLEKLAKRSEQQVMDLHGIGANAMKTLKKALEDKGLAFTNAAKNK